MRRPTTGAPEFGKANFYGAGKTGFTEGAPGTEAATVVTDDTLNHVVGELCNAIEVFGATALDALKYDQLSTVLSGAVTSALARANTTNTHTDIRNSLFNPTNILPGVITSINDVTPLINNKAVVLVAVGEISGLQGMRYSNDYGLTWTTMAPGSAYNSPIFGINRNFIWGTAGEIQFFTGFSGAVPQYSRQKTGGADIINVIAGADNIKHMACDTVGHVFTKDVALTAWTDLGVKLGVGSVTSLVSGFRNGVAVFAVTDGSSVKYSTDNGVTWVTAGAIVSGGTVARRIVYTGVPGMLWAVSTDHSVAASGGVFTSNDMALWTKVPGTNAQNYFLTPIPGGFLTYETQAPLSVSTWDGVALASVGSLALTSLPGDSRTTRAPIRYQPLTDADNIGKVLLTRAQSNLWLSKLTQAAPLPAGVLT
jgi:hypothetical protein